MSKEGIYKTRNPVGDDHFDKDIIVLRRAPDDHNGQGVHYHAVGDTTGHGWMSLEYLESQYNKMESTLKI